MLLFLRGDRSLYVAGGEGGGLFLFRPKEHKKKKILLLLPPYECDLFCVFFRCASVLGQKCVPCVSRIGRSGPTTVSSIAGRRARARSVSGIIPVLSVVTVGTRGASCPSERQYPMCTCRLPNQNCNRSYHFYIVQFIRSSGQVLLGTMMFYST